MYLLASRVLLVRREYVNLRNIGVAVAVAAAVLRARGGGAGLGGCAVVEAGRGLEQGSGRIGSGWRDSWAGVGGGEERAWQSATVTVTDGMARPWSGRQETYIEEDNRSSIRFVGSNHNSIIVELRRLVSAKVFVGGAASGQWRRRRKK